MLAVSEKVRIFAPVKQKGRVAQLNRVATTDQPVTGLNPVAITKRGCVKTLAQPFSIIYSPVIFSFVCAAFFSFIW